MSTSSLATTRFRVGSDPRYFMHLIVARGNKLLKDRLHQFKLSPLEWRALSHLYEAESCSTTSLARLMPYERSSVAKVIDKLEKWRLVRRSSHEADQRQNCLYLTPSGQKKFERTFKAVEDLRGRTLQGLSPREVQGMRNILSRIHGNLLTIKRGE